MIVHQIHVNKYEKLNDHPVPQSFASLQVFDIATLAQIKKICIITHTP